MIEKTQKRKFIGSLFLLGTAMIWGSAFVFQRKGTENIDAFTFNTFRASISCVVFAIASLIAYFCNKNKHQENKEQISTKKLLWLSFLAGFVLFVACSFQQLGLEFTTASKSGFLTSTQVVIVPVLVVFLRKKVKLQIWLCTLLALIGFYVMSAQDNFIPSLGDSLTLIGAIFFSIQVLVCDYISHKVDIFKFGMLFSLVFAFFSMIAMFIFETPEWTNIKKAIIPLLYVGLMSGVVATALQIFGQRETNPTISTLILSLQSVFALIFGVIFLKETITLREGIGCAMVLISVILSQTNFQIFKKKLSTKDNENK